MHDAHKDQGLVIVSLSDEPAETINEFNKKAGMDWIIGAGSSSGRDYGVKRYLFYFIYSGAVEFRFGVDDEYLTQIVAQFFQ